MKLLGNATAFWVNMKQLILPYTVRRTTVRNNMGCLSLFVLDGINMFSTISLLCHTLLI